MLPSPRVPTRPDRTIVKSALVVAVMVLFAHIGSILRNCSTSQQTNLLQLQPLRCRHEGIDVSFCPFSHVRSVQAYLYIGYEAILVCINSSCAARMLELPRIQIHNFLPPALLSESPGRVTCDMPANSQASTFRDSNQICGD